MQKIEEVCCYYVALLRAVYLQHQLAHWTTTGKNFYGSHLLFERIYKSAAEDADSAAERMVGLFGSEALDANMQAQMIGKTLERFSTGDPIESSLGIEKLFLDYSERFYGILEDEDKLTLGVSDLLAAIASNREAAVYLLQQSQKEHGEHMNTKMAGRITALKQIKNAEQTDIALKFQHKLNNELNVNLANRNWGPAGFRQLYVDYANNAYVCSYDIVIPTNSPPYTNKKLYPNGLNQFKTEIIALVNKVAEGFGIENLTQTIKVNGQ